MIFADYFILRGRDLVFLRIMWVFRHFSLHVPADMMTVGGFQSDWRKCNPIKSSKVNGDGIKHRSVPEVFLAFLSYSPTINNFSL